MSTDPAFVIVSTIALIAASAFFVIIEFSLLGSRRHRLEEKATGSRSVRAALRGVHELTIMLAGAQLGITLCTFALGAITKPGIDAALGPVLTGIGIPAAVAGGVSFLLSLLLVTFLHLVVGEMAPKSWAIASPERTATLIALPARAFVTLVRPLLLFANRMANRLVAASGVQPVERAAAGGHDARTLRHLVEHSGSSGVLESEVQEQLDEVLALTENTVLGLIDPADVITSASYDASVAVVQDLAARTGHKRIVLHGTPTGAGPSGPGRMPRVVHVRDTLLADPGAQAAEFSREAHRLPADMPVYEALTRIQESKEQLAVVMREGTLVGVVTATDIMQRILPRVG